MWHKGTSVYISYCRLQQVTQPHCNMLHSHQQHTAAIYFTVLCDTKEYQYTFLTAGYSRSHSHTAICYIAISNIQQPYISLSVSCDTKEHQYTFRTASYSRLHSHTAICYIAISNIKQPHISVSVSCDTKEHQYTFRTASYSRSHNHTSNQTIISYWLSVVSGIQNSVQESPSNGSRYTDENL